jgi:hypothetical protein
MNEGTNERMKEGKEGGMGRVGKGRGVKGSDGRGREGRV